jgi:hypothetical protein
VNTDEKRGYTAMRTGSAGEGRREERTFYGVYLAMTVAFFPLFAYWSRDFHDNGHMWWYTVQTAYLAWSGGWGVIRLLTLLSNTEYDEWADTLGLCGAGLFYMIVTTEKDIPGHTVGDGWVPVYLVYPYAYIHITLAVKALRAGLPRLWGMWTAKATGKGDVHR